MFLRKLKFEKNKKRHKVTEHCPVTEDNFDWHYSCTLCGDFYPLLSGAKALGGKRFRCVHMRELDQKNEEIQAEYHRDQIADGRAFDFTDPKQIDEAYEYMKDHLREAYGIKNQARLKDIATEVVYVSDSPKTSNFVHKIWLCEKASRAVQ